MKVFVLTLTLSMITFLISDAQSGKSSVNLDIMALTVNTQTLDSVSLKISVPKDLTAKKITFPATKKNAGDMIIAGMPYDSIGIQLPADVTLMNQYGENAKLNDIVLMYGSSDEDSSMDLLSPGGCVMIQVPPSGRIHVKVGGDIESGQKLRGLFTGSIRFDCGRESSSLDK